MSDQQRQALEKLADSYQQRADSASAGVGYTRSGYLTRDSVGLSGMAIAYETAARELRAALTVDDTTPTAPGSEAGAS